MNDLLNVPRLKAALERVFVTRCELEEAHHALKAAKRAHQLSLEEVNKAAADGQSEQTKSEG